MNGTNPSLFTCDLICRGVPSPEVFQSFLQMLERGSGKPLTFYAHRGFGIRDKGFEVARYEDGSCESGTVKARVWSRIWHKYLLRESCFRCGFHSTTRPGDITLGDFWGYEASDGLQEDRWGSSSILVNNDRGISILSGASPALKLLLSSKARIANDKQPMLLHPPMRGPKDAFWPRFEDSGFESACHSIGVLGIERAAKDAIKKLFPRSVTRSSGGNSARDAGDDVLSIDFSTLQVEGKYPIAFAARNLDDTVRRMSSSGGVFHALASHVIENLNGVVYGCAFNEGLRAVHIRCETMGEVERCMGSKYTQSDMGSSIRMILADLEEGRTVLFTGTPCQVAAVRAVCGEGEEGGGAL